MIGVDGFTGLPNSEGVFKKNAFSDTSLVMCREGIYRSKQLYDITKKNIAIEQFLYHQKDQILKRIVDSMAVFLPEASRTLLTNSAVDDFPFVPVMPIT
jgi:5-formaminoimidazole-4-carboxamide-1-beta-D-ribofuranosyl 5'-monophosphate synthetase